MSKIDEIGFYNYFFLNNSIEERIGSYSAVFEEIFSEDNSLEKRLENFLCFLRKNGHLYADINPLHPQNKDLEKEFFFTEIEKEKMFSGDLLGTPFKGSVGSIISRLKKVYSSFVGVEIDHVEEPLAQVLYALCEKKFLEKNFTIEQEKHLYNLISKADLFETFLHTKFIGQKRFSLEGAETFIPLLYMVIEDLAEEGVEKVVIGMAHRGRLNVLCNLIGKSYEEIFSEFQDVDFRGAQSGSGDVKYHKGYRGEIKTLKGKNIEVFLSPNPSHLEAIDPVVEGQVRALQMDYPEEIRTTKVAAILVHGDAAFAGQGVVYETLQMNSLKGYGTGGTIHIIINNQIGFTTRPEESRSTKYCTDIAKGFSAPIFHVNALHPQDCVEVGSIASQLRQTFHTDVFIDLLCWRRYGHNETDEPFYTQPLDYTKIGGLESVRLVYKKQLLNEGKIDSSFLEKEENAYKEGLSQALSLVVMTPKRPKEKENFFLTNEESFSFEDQKEHLEQAAHFLTSWENEFFPHPKIEGLFQLRKESLLQKNNEIDWGTAEYAAFATLLQEGYSLRLSGQDVRRGTFSHRHAVLYNQKKETTYTPLEKCLKPGHFVEIHNSPLSEYAILGFEYGFATLRKDTLTIWEAQFGDFVNGAQTIIDQFLSSAEEKWGQQSGIVLLLPHGFEGQGPEHSSCRYERFLSLAADGNMQITYPTTPAQIFHLLRRQVHFHNDKPLIVMTPKGFLRHPLAVSSYEDIVKGKFFKVLTDSLFQGKMAKRIIFTTGKIYYEIAKERKERDPIEIFRIEELYPFPEREIRAILDARNDYNEVFWVQEEPLNMGGAFYMEPRLKKLLPGNVRFQVVSRIRSASPATGSISLHKKEQDLIIKQSLAPFI